MEKIAFCCMHFACCSCKVHTEQSDGNLGSKELAEGRWFVAGVWLWTWTWGLGAGDGIPLVPAGRPAGNVGVRFYTCLPLFFCVSFKLLLKIVASQLHCDNFSRLRAVGSFALLKPAKGFLYMNPSIGDIAYIILIHSTYPRTAGTMSGISKLSPPSCWSLPVLL
jgi:hypothetical protein